MSQTVQERKKQQKKVERRKRYVTHRNRKGSPNSKKARLKKLMDAINNKSTGVDGADFYKQLKDQEKLKNQNKPKQSLFKKIINKVTKGRQK